MPELENEVPYYRATCRGFIAPDTIEEGDTFRYSGPYGTWMEPLNETARAKAEAFFEAHPNAGLKPSDNLRVQGGDPGEKAEVVERAPSLAKQVANGEFTTLGQPGKAQAGPTEGGKRIASDPTVKAPKGPDGSVKLTTPN